MRSLVLLLLLLSPPIAVLASLPAGTAHAASFRPLEFRPSAISGDGLIVVGERSRWSVTAGSLGIGVPAQGAAIGSIEDVSFDGSRVVGAARIDRFIVPVTDAFQWDASAGFSFSGLAPDRDLVAATAISPNQAFVVGIASEGGPVAPISWPSGGGPVFLDRLDPNRSAEARDVSNGGIAVGYSETALGRQAVRWHPDLSVQGLGDLAGGLLLSEALAISADGTTIVGFGVANQDDQAVRWGEALQIESLGSLDGYTAASRAKAVSADGTSIVGRASSGLSDPDPFRDTAFLWTESEGMQDLAVVLAASGVDLAGWTLEDATGISADGRSIVGTAIDPSGVTRGYLAVIPEPSAACLLGLGLAVLAGSRPRARGPGRAG